MNLNTIRHQLRNVNGTAAEDICCEDHYERSGPRPREVVFCRSIWAASRIADRIMVCRSWMRSRS